MSLALPSSFAYSTTLCPSEFVESLSAPFSKNHFVALTLCDDTAVCSRLSPWFLSSIEQPNAMSLSQSSGSKAWVSMA